MDLEIRRRKNWSDVTCIAPFINGLNVWDIPENEWTPAVQQAVLYAYKIGWTQCLRDINDKVNPPSIPRDWSGASLRNEVEER